MKLNSEKKFFFLKCMPLYVLVFITCFVSSCSFGLYTEYIRDKKIFDTGNIIYAELTDTTQIPNGAGGYSNNWWVYYEYDDGKYFYRGAITVNGEERAESLLNTQIPIYIDGHGHSIAVSEYNHMVENNLTRRALIFGIVSAILFCILTGISVYLFISHKKKVKIAENQNDT